MSLDEERRIWEEKARRAEEEAVASGSRFRAIGEVVDGKIVREDQDTVIRNRLIRRLNRGELRFVGEESKDIPEKKPEPEEVPIKTWREARGFNRFGTIVSGSFFFILMFLFLFLPFHNIFSTILFLLGIIIFMLFLVSFFGWRWTPDSDEMTPEYLKYVNDLIKALKEDSKVVRHNAAQALEEIVWEKDSYGEISNYEGIRSDYLLAKDDYDLNLKEDINQADDVIPEKDVTDEEVTDEEEKNSTSIVIKDTVRTKSRIGGLGKYETEHERDDADVVPEKKAKNKKEKNPTSIVIKDPVLNRSDIIINIPSKEEARKRRVQKAKERESALDYDSAIEIWEQLGQTSEAVRVRKLKAHLAAPKTEIHGDYVDDRDTIVKDSVINRSNVGAGGKTKGERIKLIKELLDSGAIDDAEFKQMKKEILGVKNTVPQKKVIKKKHSIQTITVECPDCGNKIDVPKKETTQEITCSHCGLSGEA